MNDEQIEKLLHKAPSAQAPDDLAKKLKANIDLPSARRDFSAIGGDTVAPSSWLKRWLPAFSVAIILLSCVVVLAIQSSTLKELFRQNATLREQTKDLETFRQKDSELEKLRLENQELERLQKDNAELKRLQEEIVRLREQLGGLTAARAENEQLKSKIATQKSSLPTIAEVDEATKAKAESIQCVNHLKQIGLAFRVWEGDNNDKFPTDYILMTNELSTWKILQCPSDKSRAVSSWADVRNNNVSYVRVSNDPNFNEVNHPNAVILQCPIHGNVLLYDGSVQRGPEAQQHLQVIDGITTYAR